MVEKEGQITICSTPGCNKVKVTSRYWKRPDESFEKIYPNLYRNYLDQKSKKSFSHGCCPECEKQTISQLGLDKPYEEESFDPQERGRIINYSQFNK